MAPRSATRSKAHDTPPHDPIFAMFEEIVRSRDRLAGLSPLTAKDLASITVAMHEIVWAVLRPPRGAPGESGVPIALRSEFARAARDRSGDLYTMLVAALAMKLAGAPSRQTAALLADDVRDGIDGLAFDFRATKVRTLELLGLIKVHVEDRIAHLRNSRREPYRFMEVPERYKDRPNKRERPDRFLRRVYGAELKRGLTQADIRDVDPAFYNVLHVWCSRHGKRMTALVPTSRARAR